MADFVESRGLALFAHRLRRLSEALLNGCAEWMPEAGVTAPPKASSTMLLLSSNGPQTVTEIASQLKLTHPLIILLTRELEKAGLVAIKQDPNDGRRRLVSLTSAGRRQAQKIVDVHRALAAAYREVFDDAGADGYKMIVAIEQALARRDLRQRLRQPKSLPATSARKA